jgi:hypothetical protein
MALFGAHFRPLRVRGFGLASKGHMMSKDTTETSRTETTKASGKRANLDRQYGNIGISAVAAALPYAGQARNASSREGEKRSDTRKRSILAV